MPNKTIIGYEELPYIEAAVKFDVHLMVKKPQDQLRKWFHTHADRFIVHVESEANLSEIIKNIKEHKRVVGLSINPETKISEIELYLDQISFLQFMTIHPGFQGSAFMPEVVDKISSFHAKYPDIIIMCDGGVTPEMVPQLVKAGASVLVSGSYIVKSGDVGKAIGELRRSISP